MQLTTLVPLWRAAIACELAERSVDSYVDHVHTFIGHLSDPTIADITYQAIEAYKQRFSREHAARTVGLALTAIRSFVRWQIDCDLRQDDPTRRVRFPRPPKSLPRALSDDQVRELLAALAAMPAKLMPQAEFQWRRNRLAILLLLYTGMRIMELANLRCRDVDLAAARLTIRDGKGDKDRTIPIHIVPLGELRLVLAERRPKDAVCGHPHGPCLSLKSWHHVFERWVPEQLGLSFTLTAHPLRHTFITALIDHGANVFEAQELAGHESPETTRVYYRLSSEHLRAAIDRLPSSW